MKLQSVFLFISTGLLSSMLYANSIYQSGIDEHAEADRYRFITKFGGENATSLTKDKFNQTVQQHIKNIFGNKNSVDEKRFVDVHEQKTNADLAKAREGQIRQTQVRFASIDANKDGFIDLHEFQNIGLKSFERYDTNKDGLITSADDQTKTEEDAQQKDGEQLTPRLKSLLTMPTTHNAQGFLALYAEGKPQLSLANYLKVREEQYQRSDSNNNGKVDIKEYEAEFLTRVDAEIAKAKAAQTALTKARFNAIDSNHDGKISRQDVVNNFAQGYFNYWDKNQDGKVTLDEPLP